MLKYCLRRVYLADRGSVSDAQIDHWSGFSQPVGSLTVEVGVNSIPRPGLPLPVQGTDELIRGQNNTLSLRLHQTLEDTPYSGKLITEVICWIEVEDPALITEEDRDHLRGMIDFFSLAIGLSTSPQFVGTMIGEDEGHELPDGRWTCRVGRPVRLIESPLLTNAELRDRVLDWITEKRIEWKSVEREVLHWLLRAWRERELTSRFLALFIPLEMLLEGYGGKPPVSPDVITELRELVHENGGDRKTELLQAVGLMASRMRPSLNARFAAMAEAVHPATADVDIAAFKKFNRMRNALLHQGKNQITERIMIEERETVSLQGLTEKYVCASIFPTDSLS